MILLGGVVSSVLASLPYHLTFQLFGNPLFTLYW